MQKRGLAAVVLAAGLGKRMGGRRAKALFRVGERTMLERVLDVALASGCEKVVVIVGFDRESVVALLPDGMPRWALGRRSRAGRGTSSSSAPTFPS